MFEFFKKKASKEAPKIVEIKTLSTEEIANIQEEIEQLISVVNKIDISETKLLAKQHEQIGIKFASIDKSDRAIHYLEASLELEKSIGDGYKKLMSLYNAKRAEAAKKGDGEGIDLWMGKMDEMRNIAKQVTISR